jgi:hypothetical protein
VDDLGQDEALFSCDDHRIPITGGICEKAKSGQKEGVPVLDEKIKMLEDEELSFSSEKLALGVDDAGKHFQGVDVCLLDFLLPRSPQTLAEIVSINVHGKAGSDFNAPFDRKPVVARAHVEELAKGLDITSDLVAELHRLLSARSRFRKFGFSERFCQVLDDLIVPGKENHVSIDQDFHALFSLMFCIIEHLRHKKIHKNWIVIPAQAGNRSTSRLLGSPAQPFTCSVDQEAKFFHSEGHRLL